MRLVLMLHGLIGTTLAGVAVVVALVMGYGTLWPLLAAAGLGWAIGWPVSWYIARQMRG